MLARREVGGERAGARRDALELALHLVALGGERGLLDRQAAMPLLDVLEARLRHRRFLAPRRDRGAQRGDLVGQARLLGLLAGELRGDRRQIGFEQRLALGQLHRFALARQEARLRRLALEMQRAALRPGPRRG